MKTKSTTRNAITTSPMARPNTRAASGSSRASKASKAKGKQVISDQDDATFPNMRSLADCTIFIDTDTTAVDETHNAPSHNRILPRELTHPHEATSTSAAVSGTSTAPSLAKKKRVPLAPITPIDSFLNVPQDNRRESANTTDRTVTDDSHPVPITRNDTASNVNAYAPSLDRDQATTLSQQALQELADEAQGFNEHNHIHASHPAQQPSTRAIHVVELQSAFNNLQVQLTNLLINVQELANQNVEQYRIAALAQQVPHVTRLVSSLSNQISQHMDFLEPNVNATWMSYQRTMERYQQHWEQM
ncbi:hypothetical protein BGW42_007979, partial [Actinomortierella wolfii]